MRETKARQKRKRKKVVDGGGSLERKRRATSGLFFSLLNRSSSIPKKPHQNKTLTSDVSLPDTTFPIYDTLGRAADEGRLSQLQLEAALHACSSHSRFLPVAAANTPALAALGRGPRLGFFCGDGAGVGKGRTIAAVILDSVVRVPEFWKR